MAKQWWESAPLAEESVAPEENWWDAAPVAPQTQTVKPTGYGLQANYPVQPEDQGTFGNVVDAFQGGVYGGIKGIAETSEQLFGAGEGVRDWAAGREAQQYETMSPDFKKSMEKELFKGGDDWYDVSLGEGATDWQSWLGKLAQTAGMQIDMLLPGGAITKGGKMIAGQAIAKQTAKHVDDLVAQGINKQVAKKTAAEAAARKTKAANRVAAMAGYGAAETAVTAGSVAIDVRDMMQRLPDETIAETEPFQRNYQALLDQGMDHGQAFAQARQQTTEQAASDAAANVAPFTFLFGAGVGPMWDKVFSAGMKGGVAKRFVKGFAGEAAQETPQSGAEHYFSQEAVREYGDPSIDPEKGIGGAMAEGGVLGGLTGGIIATPFSGGKEAPSPDPKKEQPTEERLPQVGGILGELDPDAGLTEPAPTVEGPPIPTQEQIAQRPETIEYDYAGPPIQEPGTELGATAGLPQYEGGIDYVPEGPAPLPTDIETQQQADRRIDQDERIGALQDELRDVKLPENFTDPRMKRAGHRAALESMAGDLTKGGGLGVLYDENGKVKGKLPSINPAWFKEWSENKPTVEKVQKTVEKALAGKKLGVGEQRIVTTMLDEVTGERTSPDSMDFARDKLESHRRMREAGFGTPVESVTGENFMEDAYDETWNIQQRQLREIIEEAEQKLGYDEVERVIIQTENADPMAVMLELDRRMYGEVNAEQTETAVKPGDQERAGQVETGQEGGAQTGEAPAKTTIAPLGKPFDLPQIPKEALPESGVSVSKVESAKIVASDPWFVKKTAELNALEKELIDFKEKYINEAIDSGVDGNDPSLDPYWEQYETMRGEIGARNEELNEYVINRRTKKTDAIAEKTAKKVPDGALVAAADYGDTFSAPLNIFTPEEQQALRKAGLVFTDRSDTGREYEAVKTDPLFAERDRRSREGKKKRDQQPKKGESKSKSERGMRDIRADFENNKTNPDHLENLLNELWPRIEGADQSIPGNRAIDRLYEEIQQAFKESRGAFEITPAKNDGIIVKGDKEAIRAKLKEAGIEVKGLPMRDGLRFGKNQAESVRGALESITRQSKEPSKTKEIAPKEKKEEVADQSKHESALNQPAIKWLMDKAERATSTEDGAEVESWIFTGNLPKHMMDKLKKYGAEHGRRSEGAYSFTIENTEEVSDSVVIRHGTMKRNANHVRFQREIIRETQEKPLEAKEQAEKKTESQAAGEKESSNAVDDALIDLVMEKDSSATINDVLNVIIAKTSNPIIKHIAKMIRALNLNIAIRPMTQTEMRERKGELGVYVSSEKGSKAYIMVNMRPFIESTAHKITLTHTLMHETIHAAANETWVGGSEVRNQLDALRKLIMDQTGLDARDEYGFTNVEEFIAEVFSNESFQNRLKEIEIKVSDVGVKGETTTAWDAFVDIIRKLLNIPKAKAGHVNALEQVLNVSESMLSEKTAPKEALPESGVSVSGGARWARDNVGTFDASRVDPEHADKPWVKAQAMRQMAGNKIQSLKAEGKYYGGPRQKGRSRDGKFWDEVQVEAAKIYQEEQGMIDSSFALEKTTDLLGDDTTTTQAAADLSQEKDEKRSPAGERPAEAQSGDDLFASGGTLEADMFEVKEGTRLSVEYLNEAAAEPEQGVEERKSQDYENGIATTHVNERIRKGHWRKFATQELKDLLKEHKGTPWARETMRSLIYRQEILDVISGKLKPEKALALRNNGTLAKELAENGMDGAWEYVKRTGMIGHASKPVNAVNSSLINCKPSKDCAKFCYACAGMHLWPNAKAKAELVDLLVQENPKKAASITFKQFKTARSGSSKAYGAGRAWRTTMLRMFDIGDITPKHVEFMKQLNRYNVRLHVFSKKPELLSQIDSRNALMLSVDGSNVDIVEGNTLPLAVNLNGGAEEDLLTTHADRVQVVLPVMGTKDLGASDETINEIPATLKDKVCPYDSGKKKGWDCVSCDKGKGIGCAAGQITLTDHFSGGRGALKDVKALEQRLTDAKDITDADAEKIKELLRSIHTRLDSRGETGDAGGSGATTKDTGQEAGREGQEAVYEGYEVNERDTNQVREPDTSTPAQGDLFAPSGVPGETASTQSKDNFNVSYKQVEVGEIRSAFEAITTPEEAAHLVAPIRKHGQETMMAVVTDADGKVLNVIRHTKGVKDASNVSPVELAAAIGATKGAAGVWFAHNHPTGDTTPSSADQRITKRITDALDGSYIRVHGHLIAGTGKQLSLLGSNGNKIRDVEAKPGIRKKSLAITERMLRKRVDKGPQLTQPEMTKQYIQGIDSESGILLLDNKHHVIGVLTLSPEEMKALRKEGRVNRILKTLDSTNAAAVITFGKGEHDNALDNLGNYLTRLSDLRVLDSIREDNGVYNSMAEGGRSLGSASKPFFSRKPRPAPTGTTKSQVEQWLEKPISKLGKWVKVKTVQSVSEVPGTHPEDVRGIYVDGKVYLVADNITKDDARTVLAHEVVGHLGLETLLGKKAFTQLTKQIQNMKRLGNKRINAVVTELKKNYVDENGEYTLDEAQESREILAHLAENNPEFNLVRKIVAKIRMWLARHGLGNFDNAMLESMLVKAAKHTETNYTGFMEENGQFVPAYMVAWHGSQHDHNKFDSSKIGTGEGAQAYGYGLYFAGNREVAEWYRENLSNANIHSNMELVEQWMGDQNKNYKDYVLQEFTEEIGYSHNAEYALDQLKEAESSLKNQGRLSESSDYSNFISIIEDRVASGKSLNDLSVRPGKLYQVELAPTEEEYLLWDKPLSEQSEKVQEIIRQIPKSKLEGGTFTLTEGHISKEDYAKFYPGISSKALDAQYQMYRSTPSSEITVPMGDLYWQLVDRDPASGKTESAKAASEYLHSLGIRGIKYLDGTSRGKGEGNYNYVIFSDEDVEIQAKYSRKARGDGGEQKANPFQEQNQRLREEDMPLWDKAQKVLKRYFSPGGLLPKAVFKEKVARDSEFEVVEFDVRHLTGRLERAVKKAYGKRFEDLDTGTIEALGRALGGEVDSAIPEGARQEIYAMRQYVDRLSGQYAAILSEDVRRLTEEGSPEAEAKATLLETIAGNIGTYVNRSYRAFDDKAWFSRIPDGVLNTAREYLRARYEENGETPGEASRLAEVTMHEIVKTGTAYDSMESFIKESKLGAKDLSVLKKRKQIAPAIRALLGEYTDPRMGFAKSATKMGRLIWNQKFLDRVREHGLGEFLFEGTDRPPEATKQFAADGSEAYAPLNGLWTYPEVEQAFRDALGKEQMANWYRTIVQMNGMVKFGKTILSPTTAMRNWQSAMFFTLANGHFDISHASKSLSGLREYFTQQGEGSKLAYLREMKQLGVVYDTPYAGEMMRLLDDSRIEDMLKGKKGKAVSSVEFMLKNARQFYQYGDDFWKIIGFENEKRLLMKHAGMSETEAKKEAAERIRNTYPTYSMVGKAMQSLRRFPLAGTFVSFPAEIIRTSINIVKYMAKDMKTPGMRPIAMRRAAGLAIASSFAYALQEMMKTLVGIDDDEEEAVRQLAAPWQRNSNLVFTGRKPNGDLQYIDISFVDPYNYWKRPITAVIRDQDWKDSAYDVIKETLSPFLGTDIAAGAIFEILSNKREGSGAPVYSEHDKPWEITKDIAGHLRKNLQPGLASNIERTLKAIRGEKSPSGRKYTPFDEAMAWGGWRVSTLDPKVSLYYRSYDFKDAKRDATKKLNRVIRNPNRITQDELRDAWGLSAELRGKAYDEMGKIIHAARKSGLSPAQVRSILRKSGITKKDAFALMSGRVPVWRPSAASLRNALKKADVLFDKETAGRFKKRYQEVKTFGR